MTSAFLYWQRGTEAGEFKAFVNACRHRGARLTKRRVERGVGFICPFHAWTYSTSGELLGIPQQEHFGPLNDACEGLISLPASEHKEHALDSSKAEQAN